MPTTPAHNATVATRLAWRASQTPQAIAWQPVGTGVAAVPVSWENFAQRVGLVRRGLAAAGLRRGDRLALIAPVSLDWELLHHAAMGMGVGVVGLDAHDLPERLSVMAARAGVTAYAVADASILVRLAVPTQAGAPVCIDMDGHSTSDPQRWTMATLAQAGANAAEPEPAGPQDTAAIVFTSGTTGAPKGIAYTHAQLGLAIDAICDAFNFVGTGGRLLCWLPLSNLFQRVVNLSAMQNGVTTYLLSDPRAVMAHVAAVGPDVFIGVPRFFEKLHEGLQARIRVLPGPVRALTRWAWRTGQAVVRHQQAGVRPPVLLRLQHGLADRLVLGRIRAVMGLRLRCLVSGSAPLSRALLDDLEALGWPVLEAYGLSENVLPMAMNRLADRRLGSVGRPLLGNHIRVGDDGVLRVQGDGVFSGYLGEPPGSGRDPDGAYITGDIGHLDIDGYLHLTGRLGDLIKTSTGRRVAPAGVEAVLQTAEGVDQAALFGAGRKMLVALCTCLPGAADLGRWPGLQAAILVALTKLNPFERPAAVLVLDQPFGVATGELTPNLKLRRAAIELLHADQLETLCRQAGRSVSGGDGKALVLRAADLARQADGYN